MAHLFRGGRGLFGTPGIKILNKKGFVSTPPMLDLSFVSPQELQKLYAICFSSFFKWKYIMSVNAKLWLTTFLQNSF